MSQGVAYNAGARYLVDDVPGQQAREIGHWNGGFYRYDNGVYRPHTDGAIERDFTRWVARNPGARQDPKSGSTCEVKRAFVANAMLAIRAEAALPDDLEPGSFIGQTPANAVGPFCATVGGIIDLGRLGEPDPGLIPPTPEFFALSALPVAPAPTADCPAWDEFLDQTFPGHDAAKRLLLEIFGYALWPDCRYEKFFVL